MAEVEGFEPPGPEGLAAFKAVERTNAQHFQMADLSGIEPVGWEHHPKLVSNQPLRPLSR
jgi:hypothetical protein